ncbi:CpaD family pilus assembly lipoprotein [Novosphingobium sp. FKTRR1]|uniref:CpaD family pilus assembly protein n=1 Tax=Novosphingobium sp. FKTRR1 TaxID=2879118 RepID=UPI001CF090B8|nr:CpaD family pilus assembly lipoprotein [Novosphingobium sp. FKTRR1]
MATLSPRSAKPRRMLASAALALALTATLGGCGGVPNNRMLDSVHQPVVEKTSYTYDLTTLSGGGLPISEQSRLADWFGTLDLQYGDRIAVDDPDASPVTTAAIGAIAARFGLLLADIAPVTSGTLSHGSARVVVTRSVASVPGCPDWTAHSDANPANATSTNYGCAVNSNLAAMVANKQDLVHGARSTGVTSAMTASKAIQAYRDKPPTGAGDLKQVSSKSTGGGN